jgi:type IV secretion system protein VirB10
VNQNLPPNQTGRPHDDEGSDSQRDPQRDSYRDPVQDDRGENPYYANQRSAPPPDLDANAPTLKSNELQRLNRKALVFLAGIVALLIVAAFWMFKSASSGKDETTKPREEAVVIPELPRAPEGEAPVQEVAPIELAQSQVEVPPLPQEPAMQPAYPSDYGQAPTGPRAPTLMERRMANADGSDAGGGGTPGKQSDPYVQAMLATLPGNQQNAGQELQPAEATSAQFINKPDALLVRGTYIRCVLETRIITDIPGFTSCLVTEPVYSINGRRLLLPKGSKMLGSYNVQDPKFPRVSVIWDRITTPNGIDVSMASPGIDNLGSAGHPGKLNSHWGSKISAALFISLLSDAFKYAGEKNGPTTTTVTSGGQVIEQPFQSNTARTVERLANQAVDRYSSRPATVTINQGTVVNIYVAKDVDFSGVLARN